MFGVEYYTQYVMYYEFYGILRESQPDSIHHIFSSTTKYNKH